MLEPSYLVKKHINRVFHNFLSQPRYARCVISSICVIVIIIVAVVVFAVIFWPTSTQGGHQITEDKKM